MSVRLAEGSRFVDNYGRTVRKLRISVTDRCNFRCIYCMPENPDWMPKTEILTFEEIVRVARICTERGVESIRLTGGEPLVRRDVEQLVAMLRDLPGLRRVSMTTNGVYLPEKLADLRTAGLDSVNISLDTLRPDRFVDLVRRDAFHDVIKGIEAAIEANVPVKVNTVVMRGFNDDEIADFIEWGRRLKLTVRFIEFMPLDGDRRWNESLVVTADEILEAAAAVSDWEPVENDPSEPARRFRLAGGGEFGIIASVSRPFCGACDRIRLTADGKIRNCLFALHETDLKPLLRAEASDEQVAAAIAGDVRAKWEGHLIHSQAFRQPQRPMNAIGG